MADKPPDQRFKICPECNNENSSTALLCHNCHHNIDGDHAKQFTWTCVKCKYSNQGAVENCEGCGQSLHQVESQEDSRASSSMASDVDDERNIHRVMLKSKVDNLINRCDETGERFLDDQFKPCLDSISTGDQHLRNMCTRWCRPDEIVQHPAESQTDWSLFNNPKTTDILQGALGNCWIVNSISLIAEHFNLLHKIFVSEKYNQQGAYALQICKEGAWIDLIVDDLFPCTENGVMMFSQAKRKQLWVSLIEKAFAKLFGGYSALENGSNALGLQLLTGNAVETFNLDVESKVMIDKDTIFTDIQKATQNELLVGCCTAKSSIPDAEYQDVLLSPHHAYTILGVAKVQNNRLLRIRNVWGIPSWNGDWSENSGCWDQIPKDSQPLQGIGGENDGIFWISLEDFINYFGEITICYARKNWHDYRLLASFPKVSDETYAAYQLFVETDCKLDIHLLRIGRQESNIKVVEAVLLIFDDKNEVIDCTMCKDSDMVVWTTSLPSGTYMIYCLSFSQWYSTNTPQYSFICHSNMAVQLTKEKVPCADIAEVLHDMVLGYGTEIQHNKGDGLLQVYLLQSPIWHGSIIVAVNNSPVYNYCVTIEGQLTNATSTRVPGNMVNIADVIPCESRQLLQLCTCADGSIEEGYNVELYLNICVYDGEVGPSGLHNPSFNPQNVRLHRVIKQDLLS